MTKLRLTDFDFRLSYTATAVIRRYIAPTQPCHFGPWSRFGHMPAERPASRTRCPLRVKSGHQDVPAPCPLYPQKRTSA